MNIKYLILGVLFFVIVIPENSASKWQINYWYRVIEHYPYWVRPITVACDQLPSYQCRVITEEGVRMVWEDSERFIYAFHSTGEALPPL